LKTNKVNLFVSSVLFVFWYHSPNFLDTPRTVWKFFGGFIYNVDVVWWPRLQSGSPVLYLVCQ
jgi:hypothetical protein